MFLFFLPLSFYMRAYFHNDVCIGNVLLCYYTHPCFQMFLFCLLSLSTEACWHETAPNNGYKTHTFHLYHYIIHDMLTYFLTLLKSCKYTHIHIQVLIHIFIHVCICTYIYTQIYTYIVHKYILPIYRDVLFSWLSFLFSLSHSVFVFFYAI